MVVPNTSKVVGVCKDFLHDEWACYKKSNVAKPLKVCIYSIGGKNDMPAGCIESVGKGFQELEKLFRDVIDISVDPNTPLINEDILIGADGRIIVFPERKAKNENSIEVKNTTTKYPPLPGKRTKAPSTPEASFMVGAEQIANYMLDHLKRISQSSLLNGNIKILYYLLSSAHLIKCRMLTYQQVLKAPQSKGLASAFHRCDETAEVITQHLLNYHSDIIRSSILHDASSHDWCSDRVYEEGEKVSLTIQMWSFYMQGVWNDLWRFTSPKIGEDIFCNIFTDTLGLLVTRYMQAQVSERRLSQMRGDIAAIFFIAASFLPSLTPSPRYLFRGSIQDSAVFTIHRRMDLLLRVAALKCASIETLAKVFSLGIFPSKRFSENSKEPTEIECCPAWLTFFNPSLFPADTKHLSSLPDSTAIKLTLNNAAMRPYPDNSLILRGLFMRNHLGSKTILRAIQDSGGQVEGGKPCGGAICFGHLCTQPLIPHTIYSAILQIIIKSYRSRSILNSVMQSGVKETANWDSLDRKQVWNIQRPPWHHALVQLVGLHMVPAVVQLLQTVPSESPGGQTADTYQPSARMENHLSAWTLQLINSVSEIADTLPHSLVQIAETINSCLPPTIKPVGGHVISQFAISAIYSIVNSRDSLEQLCSPGGRITDTQWDLLIAVGERLCSLHDVNYEAALDRMTKSLLQPLLTEEEDEHDEKLDDYTSEEAIEEVCQQMADHVLSSVQGQHSFGVIWEFLKRNMEWVSNALESTALLTSSANPTESKKPKQNLVPPVSYADLPDIYNPLKYHNRILGNPFKHASLMAFQGNWESVLTGDLWMPKDMIRDLIRQRPELQEDAALLTASQTSAVQTLRSHLRLPAAKKENHVHYH